MFGSEQGVVTSILMSNADATTLEVRQREFCIDNLLVRIHFTIVMIRWTGRGREGARERGGAGRGKRVANGPRGSRVPARSLQRCEEQETQARNPTGGSARVAGFRAARVESPPRRFKLIGDSCGRGACVRGGWLGVGW